uniref:Uncharacterized protein n=1 Tax=Anguilla anguilla TaxID=7936 RepID=A0A0E9S827_ANGAN
MAMSYELLCHQWMSGTCLVPWMATQRPVSHCSQKQASSLKHLCTQVFTFFLFY